MFLLKNGSVYQRGADLSTEYMLWLPTNSLLWTYRQNAGLPTPGKALGGWEAPDWINVRGQFMGHYLSACAMLSVQPGLDLPLEWAGLNFY